MSGIDDAGLVVLAALAEGATPGPWVVGWGRRSLTIDGGENAYDEVLAPTEVDCMAYCYGGMSRYNLSDPDAAFIAAARTALPALVAEVQRLRTVEAAVEALTAVLHARTEDFAFMQSLQREERRWRRGGNTRSLTHLRGVMHSLARVLDGTAARSDEDEAALAAVRTGEASNG